MKKPVATINQYLKAVPKPARTALEKVRKTIQRACPAAKEGIHYGIPAFQYEGALVGFAAFKAHCSFFPMSAAVTLEFKDALKEFQTSTGTVRFTVEKPLTAKLIKEMVVARMKENEGNAAMRKAKKRHTAKK